MLLPVVSRLVDKLVGRLVEMPDMESEVSTDSVAEIEVELEGCAELVAREVKVELELKGRTELVVREVRGEFELEICDELVRRGMRVELKLGDWAELVTGEVRLLETPKLSELVAFAVGKVDKDDATLPEEQ